MKTYTRAPHDVNDRVLRLVNRFHPDLKKYAVTFDLLFIHGDEPALTLHGAPCFAIVHAVPLKERVKGGADAEIIIDGEKYSRMCEETKDALIDHELFHLEISKDGEQIVQYDDLHRPKLKMRKHDREFGWFDEMVRRHGAYSIESQQARMIVKDTGQLYFSFHETAASKRLELPAPKAGLDVPKLRGDKEAA